MLRNFWLACALYSLVCSAFFGAEKEFQAPLEAYKKVLGRSELLTFSSNAVSRNRIKNYLERHGGALADSDLQAFVPANPSEIDALWHEYKREIGDLLGPTPKEEIEEQQKEWKNSYNTAEELYAAAKSLEGDFRCLVSFIAEESNAIPYFGPNDQYAVKNLESLRAKLTRRPIEKISDALRGSIIVHSIEQARYILITISEIFGMFDMPVVFSNKFYSENATGYVAIHADILYKTPEGSLLAEIQIHFREIEDTSSHCPKWVSHEIYTKIRDLSQRIEMTDEERIDLRNRAYSAMKTLYTMGMEEMLRRYPARIALKKTSEVSNQ